MENENDMQLRHDAAQRYREEIFDRLKRMEERLDRMDARQETAECHTSKLDVAVAELKLGIANLEEWQRRQNGTLQTLDGLIRKQGDQIVQLISDTNKRIDDLNTKAVQMLFGVVASGAFMLAGVIISQMVK